MARSHLSRSLLLLALVLVLAIGAFTGCEKSPDRQHLDNPFDPNGATGGDGLQLQALASPNQIILTWNQPQGMDIVEYFLFSAPGPNGPFEDLDIDPATESASANYIYKYPPPTQVHWFKAQAITSNGDFSLTTLAEAASAAMGPTVVVGDTVKTLATRFPVITATASFGHTFAVAFDADFATTIEVPIAGPNVPTIFTIDMGPAADGDTVRLYVKAFDDLTESLATELVSLVNFSPKHTLIDANPLRLSRRSVDMAITTEGVLNMRFATSEAELALASWQTATDTLRGYELSDSANAQEIWGEYEGDFEFNSTSRLIVRPDLLTNVDFFLKVPSNHVVSVSTVVAEFSAQATEMRVSEQPDFSTVPWLAYDDTLSFQLSAGEGTKTVYAQYRNDWTESLILSDYAIYISQGLDVNIVVPAPDSIVPGGSSLIVRGTANPGTVATTLDAVQLDLGDGLGFREVLGTENWQLTWNVPTFTGNTERILRARAWAGDLMVTDAITVMISQLLVDILDPLDGADVIGGEVVMISGTASGIVNGAPVDRVELEIGGEQILASGTETWSASWTPAVVGQTTPVDIVATVWAGTESTSQTISVNVTVAP
ncbi:MAG: Ig-like domain-containing protein [Candidatus Krumholzibacteria bacterium]|nr:Ig-like domain-containing protein [Candidatus Krumholzibacteria bacterium]